MKKSYILSLFLFAIKISFLTAQIIEIQNISELNQHAKDKNTLIVLDLDNTILEPDNETGEGSEQWFSAKVNNKVKKGLGSIEAIEKTLPSYYKIHKTLKVKPVEDNTIDTIKTLQKENTPIMGLTSRSFPMIKHTFRQLKEINLDLTPTTPGKKTMTFKKSEFPAKFNNGILFVGNNNKGKILKTYLSTISFEPEKIVMVDDKKHHLEKIDSEFKNSKISFIGLRYAFLDEKVKNFVLNNTPNSVNIFGKTKNFISNGIIKTTSLIKSPFKRKITT
ncbi:MAG: DUF2608 domain-containing protein [bacterium]